MPLDTLTLRCGQCGSVALRRVGAIQYECGHCRAITLVEHSLRPSAPAPVPLRAPVVAVTRNPWVVLLTSVGALFLLVTIGFGVVAKRSTRSNGVRSSGGGSLFERATTRIDPASVHLSEPRMLVETRGSSTTPHVLVTARNDGKEAIGALELRAHFFEGTRPLGSSEQDLASWLLMPGETHPFLFDVRTGAGDRQTVEIVELEPARGTTLDGSVERCATALLWQRGQNVRFGCRLAPTAEPFASVAIAVSAYDSSGRVVGVGDASESSKAASAGGLIVAADLKKLDAAPIARWDYRVQVAVTAGQGRATVLSANRTVGVAQAPQVWPPEMPLDDRAILGGADTLFDTAQLAVAPWQVGRDSTHSSVLLSEVSNRSTRAVAVGVGGLVTPFDGNKPGEPAAIRAAYLYPGESYPLRVLPRGIERFSRASVDWSPVSSVPLPGPRSTLRVEVAASKAEAGSVLVNFTRRYEYKAVRVNGTVTNTSPKLVTKHRLWVMLRDAQKRLAGFEVIEGGALAPGGSAPFETRIVEEGAAWTHVSTRYETE